MTRNWLPSLLACCAVAAGATPPAIHTIAGARAVRALPDGTVYVLAGYRMFAPTPGAWMQDCQGVVLSRADLRHGQTLWTTCVPIRSDMGVYVDADPKSRAAVVAGSPTPDFRPFGKGLDQAPAPGDRYRHQIAVVRLQPDGKAAEFAAAVSHADRGNFVNETVRGVRLLPDGSVLVLARVTSPGLPVTDNALDPTPPSRVPGAYVLRLSADGSHVLFGSYVNRFNEVFDLVTIADGTAVISGSARDPTEPAGLTFPGVQPATAQRILLARFDPAVSTVKFVSVDAKPLRTARISGSPNGGILLGIAERDSRRLMVAELSAAGDRMTRLHSIDAGILAFHLDTDSSGNAVIAMTATAIPPPVTAGAKRWPRQPDEAAIMAMDLRTGQVLFSHVLRSGRLVWGVSAGARDAVVIGVVSPVSQPTAPLTLGSPEVPLLPPETGVLFAALPNRFDACNSGVPRTGTLFWDVRGDDVQGVVQIRRGAPEGPVVGTGATGVIEILPQTESYYLVADPQAGPFGGPRVLATETTTLARSVRCSAVAEPRGQIEISPNPILSCSAAPNLGTQTGVSGTLSGAGFSGMTEVHVVAPSGPILVAGPRVASASTGDWVRQGMEFFVTSGGAPGVAYASDRAYLLPIRDCANPSATPPPAIRSVRDCAQPELFTLTYYIGDEAPLEVRLDSPDGETVARLIGRWGLLDVRTQRPTTYYLMRYENGAWVSIASTAANPRQPCEQGIAPPFVLPL